MRFHLHTSYLIIKIDGKKKGFPNIAKNNSDKRKNDRT